MIREAASGRPPRAGPASALFLFLLAVASAVPCTAAEGLAKRLPAAVAEAQKAVETVRAVPFRGPVASAVLPEKELSRILEKKKAPGPDACPFTTLYWDFLARHEKLLTSNQRMTMQLRNLSRKSAAAVRRIRRHADDLRGQMS